MLIAIFSVLSVPRACSDGNDLPLAPYSGQWVKYDTSAGLPVNQLWSVHADRHGNIWTGTESGGVARYNGDAWSVFTQEDGLGDNTVLAIEEDLSGNIWFGTLKGYAVYDGREIESFFPFGTDTIPVISLEVSADGSIWAGTMNSGLLKLTGHGSGYTEEIVGPPAVSVYCIEEDDRGRIWAGTDSGVMTIEQGVVSYLDTGEPSPDSVARSIFMDSWGDTWIGSWNQELLIRYTGEEFIQVSLYTTGGSGAVTAITEDMHGNVWFGLFNGGLIRFDGITMTNISGPAGVPGYRIIDITADQAGRIWIASYYDGLFAYIPSFEPLLR